MNHATQNSSNNTVNAKATFVGGNLDYGQGKVYAGFHRGNMNGANMATNVQGRDADVKQTLLASTERAVARGVFGLPTFFVGDEMYFGKDRLRDVEEEIVRVQSA